MPNLSNAKKALRQDKKRSKLNKSYKNRIKQLTREISDLAKAGKTKEAQKMLPDLYKALDKAAKKNILHKNTAARRKSVATKSLSEKK